MIARRGVSAAVDAAARLHQLRSSRRAAARLDAIGADGRDLVIGPWVSEVGFEVLYWVPLLRWVLARRGIVPGRVTVVTRGGAHAWYRDFASQHVEIFDLASPAEFRELNAQRVAATGGQKQMALVEMEAELLRRAGGRLDPTAEVVHPSLMYRAFRYFWAARAAAASVTRQLRFAPLPHIAHPALAELPQRYVAVKAYYSQSFADVPANRRFVEDLVRQLGARVPVVLLSSGERLDEHDDVPVRADGDVVVASELYDAHDNLNAQTAIVAGADALLSSYGGFSYLALSAGVPSFSFSSVRSYNPQHLEIARHAARQLGTRFITRDTQDADLLQELVELATTASRR